MIFGIEADHFANGADRIVTIFQIFNGDVDADGVEETDRRLPQFVLEKMIECGFAHAAGLGDIGNRKIAVPVGGDVFDGGLQRFVKGNARLHHLRQDALQHFVEQRIGFQPGKIILLQIWNILKFVKVCPST